MIRKVVTWIVLVPLAVLLVVLALANRHAVTLSLDPLSNAPTLAVQLPLFIAILLALAIGVVVGGTATWLRQGRWRRAARRAEALVRALRAEIETLRRQLEGHERAASASSREIAYRHPPAA
jgi:uncharacterized integral membrane protein